MFHEFRQAISKFSSSAIIARYARHVESYRQPSNESLFQLEERILYSAVPLEALGSTEVNLDVEFDGKDLVTLSENQSSLQEIWETKEPSRNEQRRELIFVDTNVDDYSSLVEGILADESRQFEIVYLEDEIDGIVQVTQELENYDQLDSVHVITHGSDSGIQLGNTWLDSNSIEGYAGEIASWAFALSSDADLLFYGCSLASTEDGRLLTDSINALTGADVAASDDLTGHDSVGGDWNLEYSIGHIETEVAIDQAVQKSWKHVLAIDAVNDSYSTDENDTINQSAPGVTANDSGGGAATVAVTGATLVYDASLDLSDNGFWEDDTGVSGHDFALDASITRNTSLIGAPAGITAAYEFDATNGAFHAESMESLSGDPTTGDATFEIWFRPDSPADNRAILMDVGSASDGASFRLYESSGDSYIEYFVNDGGVSNYLTANITSEINSGDYIQLVGTFDSATGRSSLYVNGSSFGSTANASISDWSGDEGVSLGYSTGSLKVGSDFHFLPFHGEIAIFQLYEMELDALEVQQNYDAVNSGGGGGVTVTSFDSTSTSGATVNVNSDGSFSYDPGTLFDYLKDGESVIDTFTYTIENAIFESDTATVSITVNGVTQAPTSITPNSFNVDENTDTSGPYNLGTLSATDEDTGDTFSYSIIGGADAAVFTIGGGSSDELFINDGRLDFETKPSYSVDVRVTDGGGNTYDETITVDVNDIDEAVTLWLSTQDDVASDGVPGIDNFGQDDLLQLGDPGLQFEPAGGSNGTFALLASLDKFAADNDVDVRAIHYVTRHMTLGTNDTVELFSGDILLSNRHTETMGGTVVSQNDVYVFRPDNPGDLSSGSFFVLLDNPTGENIRALTLVEQNTWVGDVELQAGTFLLTHSPDSGDQRDILHFTADEVGVTTTSGTTSILLDGSQMGVGLGSMRFDALELIESNTNIGGTILNTGTILTSLSFFELSVGSNNLTVNQEDIFALNVTTTGEDSTSATAVLITDSSDVGLNSSEEDVRALTLAPQLSALLDLDPIADNGGPYSIFEGGDVSLDATGSTDDGSIVQYLWDLNDDGVFGDVSTDTANVSWSDLSTLWGINDGDTPSGTVYDIHLRVIDNAGNVGDRSTTVTVYDTAPDIVTTGSGTVEAGASYTLNLSASDFGDDLITGWRIDWGDGEVSTIGGNPASWDHTYQVAGNYDILVSVTDEDGTHLQNSLFVTGNDSSLTYEFDVNSGLKLNDFNRSGSDLGIEFGPDGKIYTTAFGATVQRFLADGTPDGTFASGNGLSGADGLAFGPDGHLYVASFYTDSVKRFDGVTGDYIDDFAVGGGLSGASNLVFGPDGDLYVSSWNSGEVIRFDGATGAFKEVFADDGLVNPEGLVFDEDGYLYVASRGTDQVRRYSGTDGSLDTVYSDPQLDDPNGLAFGGDGFLYVGGFESDNVVRFNVTTGAMDVVVPGLSEGLDNATHLHFLPGHQVAVTPEPDTFQSLWLSTENDVSGATTDGITAWGQDTIVQIADPNLEFEPEAGSSNGQFSAVISLDVAGDGDVQIEAMHYVTRDMVVGGENSVALFAGDLLLAIGDNDETLTGTDANILSVTNKDVFIFRPDVAGVYTAGKFYMLLDDVAGDAVQGITLVESETQVGDVTLRAGDFLFSESGGNNDDIFWYQTTGAGTGTDTAGTVVTLVDGNDFSMGPRQIHGLELIEKSTTIDSVSLTTGEILVTLNGTETVSGTTVTQEDIFSLDLVTTSVVGSATGSTYLFADGDDLGISDENINAMAFVSSIASNSPPTDISPDSFSIDENQNTTGGVSLGTLTTSDPDSGESFTYSIVGGADQAKFSIAGGASDELWLDDGVLDHENDDQYNVIVRVTDSAGNTYDEAITVNVNDLNETPTGITPTNPNINENTDTTSGVTVATLTTTDPDDSDTFTYAIDGGTDAGSFSIGGAGDELVLTAGILNHEAKSSYVVDVEVTDGGGNTYVETITVDVNDLNETPTGITPINPSINENTDTTSGVTVATLSTTDPDDSDTFTYAIDGGTDAGSFSIGGAGDELVLTAGILNHEAKSSYVVDVEVTDGGGNTYVETITVDVNDLNETPTGITPINPSINENTDTTSGVTIATLSTTDPDDSDTFTYAIDGGADAGSFSIGGAGDELVLTAGILNHEAKSSYVVDVEVTDGGGNTYVETITVDVNDLNETPTGITPNNPSINENTDTTSGVTVATLTTTDPDDSDTFTYAIDGGADAGSFSIGGAGDELVLTAGVLNHETKSSYVVNVEVTDGGGNTYVETITVDVNDLNETPTGITPTNPNINENTDTTSGVTVATLTTTDPDDSDTFTYAIDGGADAGNFSIGGAGDELVLTAGILNHETKSSYVVDVEVTDGGGNTYVETITVDVNDLNETPTGITPTNPNINENSDTTSGVTVATLSTTDPDDSDTFTYAIDGGADAGSFSIGGAGDELVLTAGILNHETKSSYVVDVEVTDGGGNTYVETITVDVNDLNESPTGITPTNPSINENTDTTSGVTVATLTTTDPDDSDTFTYAIDGGADAGSFSIGGAGDELVLTAGILNHEAKSSYVVDVEVTDGGGNTYVETITVDVNDLNETPTGITPTNPNINENTDTTSGVTVATLSTTDPDDSDTFTYAIDGGADAGSFSIGGAGDELVLTAGILNHEAKSSYVVDVEVTDGGGNTYVETITVDVNDLNETPTGITPTNPNINENTDTTSGVTVATLSATDPDDSDTFTYAIDGGADAGSFSIGGAGDELVLTAGILNHEAKSSYVVDVEVTDGGGNTYVETITVDVNDLNETPTAITPSIFQVPDSTDTTSGYSVGTLSATDEDSPETFTYSIQGGVDAASFSIGGASSDELILSDGIIEFSNQSIYSVVIRVTDGGGNTYDELISVNVTGVNDAPSISNETFAIDENSSNGSVVGSVVADDADPELGFTKLYWVDVESDEIRRIDVDGTDDRILQTQSDFSNSFGPRDVFVDSVNGHVYWTNNFTASIWRADLDGGNAVQLMSGLNFPQGLAVDPVNQKIYWVEGLIEEIWSADIDGSNRSQFIDAVSDPKDLAIDLDAGKIYWTDDGTNQINRADLDGSNIETVVSIALDPWGIALDTAAGKVYWSEPFYDRIYRADMVVGATPELISASANEPRDLTLDVANGIVYWTAAATDRIEAAYFDGTPITPVVGTGDWPTGIAIGPEAPNLTYSIENGNTLGAFAIDPITGVIEVANSGALDYESNPVFNLTVRATDSLGFASDATVTINLNDVNDAPTAINPNIFAINENIDTTTGLSLGTMSAVDVDAGDTFSYAVVGGADAGVFSIGGIGGDELVLTDGVLNHEDQDSYSVDVEVTDSGGDTHVETISVTVNDLNDAPTGVTPAVINVNENTDTSSGYSLGTLTAVDEDAVDSFTYVIAGGPDAALFSIGGIGSDELILTDGILDHELKDTYFVNVRVTDGSGQQYDQLLVILVDDVNESPYEITPNNFSVDENTDTSSGLSLGALIASDPDFPETFSYAIQGGPDAGLFSIGGVGNDELIINDGILDFETQSTYNVIVRVTDSGGNQHDESIVISVDDLNEAPNDITPDSFAIAENTDTSSGVSLGVLNAADPDTGDSFNYQIQGGADASSFSIGGIGNDELIMTAGLLDYEDQSTYNVVIRVTDSGGNQYDENIVVNVSDENDAPTVSRVPFIRMNEDADPRTVNLRSLFDDAEDADRDLTYTVEAVSQPGLFDSLSINASDRLVIDLAENQNGSSTVTIRATDTGGQFTEVTFTIQVRPVNDDPHVDTPIPTVVVDEDSSPSYILLTDHFDDVDIVTNGDSLTFSVLGISNTNLVEAEIFNNYVRISYLDDAYGTGTVTVKATDTAGGTATETFSILVDPVQDATVVNGDRFLVIEESITISPASLLANDFDVDSSDLRVVLVPDSAANGTILLDADGNLVFTLDKNFAGIARFQYVVEADGVTSLPGNVTLLVSAGNLGTDVENEPEPEPETEPDSEMDPDDDPSNSDDLIVGGGNDDNDEDEILGILNQSGRSSNGFADLLADDRPNEFNELENAEGTTSLASATAYASYVSSTNGTKLIFGLATTISQPSSGSGSSSFDPVLATMFWDGLENSKNEYFARFEFKTPELVAASAGILTLSYIAWLVNGGMLLTSFVSTLGGHFDPLPLVESGASRKEEEEGVSVEQLVDNEEASNIRLKECVS